jgi:serine/threonine protein phosphatase PrpC
MGDFLYDGLLSREPHISLISLGGGREGGREGERAKYRYLVLASDGLWDVMSNEEVVAFLKMKMEEEEEEEEEEGEEEEEEEEGGEEEVEEEVEGGREGGRGGRRRKRVDWHALARALTWEAYVRGSTDNIGVLIVDLQQ